MEQIASGANHAIALREDGTIFISGAGKQNQPGHSVLQRKCYDSLVPAPVLPYVKIRNTDLSGAALTILPPWKRTRKMSRLGAWTALARQASEKVPVAMRPLLPAHVTALSLRCHQP